MTSTNDALISPEANIVGQMCAMSLAATQQELFKQWIACVPMRPGARCADCEDVIDNEHNGIDRSGAAA